MLNELYKKYILKNLKLIKRGCLILIITIVFISINIHYLKKVKSNNLTNDNLAVAKETANTSKEEINDFYIDIKGSIAKPGVYKLKEGSRIIDAVNLAGGLTDESDTSLLNLSKKLTDEMNIIIYTKNEIAKFKETKQTTQDLIKYIDSVCTCPDPTINDACIKEETTEVIKNTTEDNSITTEVSSKVSINTAPKDKLMTLTGIGETKAQAIIDYRSANGSFKTLDALKNVSGIGDSTFDKIKENITL